MFAHSNLLSRMKSSCIKPVVDALRLFGSALENFEVERKISRSEKT